MFEGSVTTVIDRVLVKLFDNGNEKVRIAAGKVMGDRRIV